MRKQKRSIEPYFLYFSISMYILLFLWLIVFTYVSPIELFNPDRLSIRSVNLIPFQEIGRYLSGTISSSVAINNLLGNIVLFIPFGLYLQLFKEDKRVLPNVSIVFFVSLVIEILQFVLAIGISDVDDIVLNTIGGIIGIFIYKMLSLWLNDLKKTRRIITIVSSVIAIPLFFIVILLYVNN